MGAWGYTPFDNDQFGDWSLEVASKIRQPLERAIKDKLDEAEKTGDPTDMWAAIGVVIYYFHAGILADEYNHLIDRAIEFADKLETMPVEGYMRGKGRRAPAGTFAETWREPAAFRRMLKKVTAHLMDMRGRHREAQPVLIKCTDKIFGGR